MSLIVDNITTEGLLSGGTMLANTANITDLFVTNLTATTITGNGDNLTHNLTGTTILNFDALITGETYDASTAVTNSNITFNSNVFYTSISSPNHDQTDFLLENIKITESDINPGVGFTINAVAPNGTWGAYYINYKIIN